MAIVSEVLLGKYHKYGKTGNIPQRLPTPAYDSLQGSLSLSVTRLKRIIITL